MMRYLSIHMRMILLLISICFGIYSNIYAQTIENEVVSKINEIRLQFGGPAKGLSPFVRNSALDSAAMYHAKWIVASRIRSHFEDRVAGGIKPLPNFWDRASKYNVSAYAENLIQYCRFVKQSDSIDISKTANLIVVAWKNSPGHLENILFTMTPKVEPRIGIAIAPYPDYEDFCIVMVVGANVDSDGNIIQNK